MTAHIDHVQAALLSALRRVEPGVTEVRVDGPYLFVGYEDVAVRYLTPPEVTYAIATGTSLVMRGGAGIELILRPPQERQ